MFHFIKDSSSSRRVCRLMTVVHEVIAGGFLRVWLNDDQAKRMQRWFKSNRKKVSPIPVTSNQFVL
jgi:hypothetical protein